MSGFTFTPKDDAGHTAVPLDGTLARENGGGPARADNDADYPITAECKICHRRIRLDRRMQMEWRHVPAPTAATGGGAA